jgi:16S rRNA (uracil1498-N3)-methyltransferase
MLAYFYHKELTTTNASFNLTEDTSKHCIQVLRMQEGEQLQLTNGNGLRILAEIITAHKKNCLVKIVSSTQDVAPTKKNTIAISLVKNATRFEWFLEKVTELGILEIVPLICNRTERQLFKQERLQAIVISAMLQSQQTYLPLLHIPIKYNVFIQDKKAAKKFIAHCVESDKKNITTEVDNTDSQIILIGPEGDFTNEEIQLAISNNYIPVMLGETRLRTETAGVVAATLMQMG